MKSAGRFIALATLILLPGHIVAAETGTVSPQPHARLVTWLDDDVGLCLELDQLAEQWGKFSESRLHAGIVRFPPIADWLSEHRPELTFLKQEIERRSGISARDVGTKLLGRQVVFAIWPPSDPLTDKPTALLLAESTDGKLMRQSLDKLIAARREAGRWRGRRTLEVGGDAVVVDVVVPDDEVSEFFITSLGDVALIASGEALVQKALTRRASNDSRGSLAASPAYLAAGQRLASADGVRAFINPRAWDAALEADLKRKPPGSDEAKSQAVIVAAWRATDYVCGGAQITPRLGVEVACEWRADDLPEPVREGTESLRGRSVFLDHLPDKALIAWAGHVDLARLVRYSIDRSWRERTGSSTKNPQEAIVPWALLAGLGPDFGGYVTSADGKDSTSSVDMVVGLQTRPLEAGTSRTSFAENIEPMLHALLSAAVESVNRQSSRSVASIDTANRDGRRITTVRGILPGRPKQDVAYCVDSAGRFWLGTSAAAVEQASKPADHTADDRDHGSMLTFNFAEWRRLVAKGPQALEFLWEGKQLDGKTKDQQYQTLLAFSKLADRLTFAIAVDRSSARLSATLEADQE